MCLKVCEGVLGSSSQGKHSHNLKLSPQQDVLVEMNRSLKSEDVQPFSYGFSPASYDF